MMIGACWPHADPTIVQRTAAQTIRLNMTPSSGDGARACPLRDSEPGELAAVGALIQRPAGRDERVDGRAVHKRGALAAELRLEVCVAHRPLAASEGVLDPALEHGAVLETDPDVRRILLEA